MCTRQHGPAVPVKLGHLLSNFSKPLQRVVLPEIVVKAPQVFTESSGWLLNLKVTDTSAGGKAVA